MKSFTLSQYLLSSFILAGGLLASQAHAAIVINGTRVIYPSDQKEVSVKLDNNGEAPMLVQSWIDEGDEHSTPDNSKAPFVLTPPISRIDKHEGQTLRVRFTDQKSMPQNKESVFWLNVLEVPPSIDDGQNKLKIAFRSRIKLFYRPTALKLDTLQIVQQMQWRLVENANAWALEGTNPTPYYLNLSAVKVGSVSAELNLKNSMLAPGEHKTLPLNGVINASNAKNVETSVINDYGGIQTITQPLTH